jgi:RimJ/RimL family protein N-acetyltransferase
VDIELRPLESAYTEELLNLLNDPRVTRHMPLAEPVDRAWIDGWKAAKSALWPQPDMGPWAVYLDGRFAGWVGVQPDEDERNEFAIVLNVWAWGFGQEITQEAMRTWLAFGDSRPVVIYLPETRPLGLLQERFGFRLLGMQKIADSNFAIFELPRGL